MEKQTCHQNVINNDFYETLGDQWYLAVDHPIALLRAENRLRADWISREVNNRFRKNAAILDVGCGAGFLSNKLAADGYDVTGIDLSQSSLDVALRFDTTQTVQYQFANAYELPFENESFDVVCAMDILEHVENPAQLIREASRVLRKNGLFFFHTFNRNPFSRFIIIKGVDWFVKNAPQNMHVYHLFITPKELTRLCSDAHLTVDHCIGLVPNIWRISFWKMLFTRTVPENFEFTFIKSLSTGYCGIAMKSPSS